MSRRETILIIFLAVLSFLFIVGAYQIQQKDAQKEKGNKVNLNAGAEEITGKKEENITKENKIKNAAGTAGKENVPGAELPQPVPGAPAGSKSRPNPFGYKVGDVVRFGDVEMIVTRSVVNNKVIDITIAGNDSKQLPKLVSIDNNRIIYEVPAVTDVSVAVRDKATVEEKQVFSGKEEAGN